MRIPDRRVIARARVAFEVRLDNARPDGTGRDDRRWGCALGLIVFVIVSRQVTALRSRYGTTGDKDDRFDACLLADVLRADRRRLTHSPSTPRPPSGCEC